MTDTVDTVEHIEVLGNTKPKPCNEKRIRGWAWTLNNYTEEEYEMLKTLGHTDTVKFIIGKEVGEECGTPHLQGSYYFKNARKFSQMKLINNRVRWAEAKGNAEHNRIYCTKEGEYVSKGMDKIKTKQELIKEKILEKYTGVVWKDWQQKIVNLIEKEADDRTINWVYDQTGNNGKTFLRKYLSLKYNVLVCDGKKDNVLNMLKTKCIDNNEEVKIIIMDIPRHMQEYINYGLLEQLKDGHVYSGKYEGGEIWLDDVHVIVMSNQRPDESKFSADRWNIIEL